MTKNSFTQKDIGAAVVFAGFDGGSYSATIVDVCPAGVPFCDRWVRVGYFPAGTTPVYVALRSADWHRLTLFPKNSNFFVLETL